MFPRRAQPQGGFLIPLAAIIVVGLGVLALAISRISGQTGTSAVHEGLSVQAFYAAESGAQLGMSQIFFSAANRTATDANCTALSGNTINYAVAGLDACSAVVICSVDTDAGNTTSFYTITSTGSCGSGDMLAQRIVQVSAYMQ